MDQRLINEKRKQVLLSPSRKNVESLLEALKGSTSGLWDKDVAFLESLFPQERVTQGKDASVMLISTKASDKPKAEGTEPRSQPSPGPARVCLTVPATAQWSFINGLGDMEWIQGECVRQCLEDKLVHAQALPSPSSFGVSITGRFKTDPYAEVSTPFHSMNYRVSPAGSAEKNNWTTYRYECELIHDERHDGTQRDILYELAFSTTSGDYMLDISYFF
jgi:hypothetical protein